MACDPHHHQDYGICQPDLRLLPRLGSRTRPSLKFDGVAHAELPFGNPQQAMVAQLPADQVLPPQAMQPMPDSKATKVRLAADQIIGPHPGEKPVTPIKAQ